MRSALGVAAALQLQFAAEIEQMFELLLVAIIQVICKSVLPMCDF